MERGEERGAREREGGGEKRKRRKGREEGGRGRGGERGDRKCEENEKGDTATRGKAARTPTLQQDT